MKTIDEWISATRRFIVILCQFYGAHLWAPFNEVANYLVELFRTDPVVWTQKNVSDIFSWVLFDFVAEVGRIYRELMCHASCPKPGLREVGRICICIVPDPNGSGENRPAFPLPMYRLAMSDPKS